MLGDLLESAKVVFAGIGCLAVLHTLFSQFTRTAPVRVCVNPYRPRYFVGGLLVLSSAYSYLALQAGNRWQPEDIGALVEPVFTQQPTPDKVRAAVACAFFLGVLPVAVAGWCWFRYPKDTRHFWSGRDRSVGQVRAEVERVVRHFTTRRGGLLYAGVLAISSGAGGLFAIDRLDHRDFRRARRRRGLNAPTAAETESRRLHWLALARTEYLHLRELTAASEVAACELGVVEGTRARTRQGGLLIERLHRSADGQPDLVAFGLTADPAEEQNHHLDEHFGMLAAALRHVVPDTAALGLPVVAVARERAGVTAPVPAG